MNAITMPTTASQHTNMTNDPIEHKTIIYKFIVRNGNQTKRFAFKWQIRVDFFGTWGEKSIADLSIFVIEYDEIF